MAKRDEDIDPKAATSGKDAETEDDLSRQRQMEILAEQRQEENTIPLEESTTTTVGKRRGRGRAKGTGRGRKKGASSSSKNTGDEGYARLSGLAKVREQAKCSSCGNPMTMSRNINTQSIPGAKLTKDKEGKYKSRSPGADEGKVTAVLCDDCVDRAQNPTYNKVDGTTAVDIKTGVIEREDGRLINVPIENLKNY